MKYFLSPRKSPDLYSELSYAEICTKLGVKDQEKKSAFKEVIEWAAQEHLLRSTLNQKKLTDRAEEKAFQELSKHLNRSIKAYEAIAEHSRFSIFRFFEGLENLETENKREKATIQSLSHDGIIIHKETIKNLLKVLEEASMCAAKGRPIFQKHNKTDLVFSWIWSFSDEWEEISEITISEGRSEDGLYVSKAMSVLGMMAAPINQNLPKDSQISNSMIAEAIKIYRSKKDERQNFNPDDLFQDF